MKIINLLAALIIFLVMLAFLTFNMLLIRVEVGEVGVRTIQYAILGEKGVEKKDFGPGWHRNLPLLDTWNIFDATVQTTEFTTSEEREMEQTRQINIFSKSQYTMAEKAYKSMPATGPERIELKSKDGYTVRLDVTVKFRIAPGKVHELYKQFNTEVRYKGIVRDQVQNTLRNVFGGMRTEEFYNPMVRREKTNEAFADLEKDLKSSHVELISILVREITFDPSYERKILDKKLADQDVELNKSRAVAEEKKGLTNKIIAETEAKVHVIEEEKNAEKLKMKAETDKQIAQIRADARLQVAKLQADADLYAAGKIAQGTLLEKEAEAEGERLKAAALKGSGGANLVAIQAASLLNLQKMNVSTLQTDFLDVEHMVQKLGAQE